MDLEQVELKTGYQWSRFGSPERVSTAAAEGREATVFVPGGGGGGVWPNYNPSKRVKAGADSQYLRWARKQGRPRKMAWEHNDTVQSTE